MKSKREKNQRFFQPNFLIRNRKGFLLAEETLKIIIALVVLVFLIYFLYSLYSAKVNGDRALQSQSLLVDSDESFKIIFSSLNEGGVFEKQVIEPSGWYFYSFSDGDIKPNLCGGESCLCLCGNAWDYEGRFNRQQKKCDDGGICLIEEDLGKFEKIKLNGDLKTIIINKNGGKIYLSE